MSSKTAAIASAALLTGFLLLRPALGRLGVPAEPDVRGKGRAVPPAEVAPSVVLKPFEGERPTPGASGGSGTPATASVSCSGMEVVEQRIFDLTNGERRRAGRQPLSPEGTLSETARAHSSDMMVRRFFDHINPDGQAPEDRVAVHHRRLVGLVGENIWRGSGYASVSPDKLAQEIMASWMSSPGHRENILRPETTHLGIGACGAGGEVRATQNFARVLAYLDLPLPKAVARGSALAVALTPVAAPVPPAEGFDLWSAERGLAVSARMALAGGRAEAEPGVYKLRVYFAQANPGRYSIFPGPQIEVR